MPTSAVEEQTKTDRNGEASEERPPEHRRHLWPWLLLLVLLLFSAYAIYRHTAQKQAEARQAAMMRSLAVPVSIAKARRGDIPVYINALGSVIPFNIATVRTRVDGQLMAVNFQEGQIVRMGDVLAQLDPRPFKVQLQQAEGQMAKDQAGLENARVDLARYEELIAQDAVPRQQLDTQKATVKQLEGTLVFDQAAIDNAKLQLTYAQVQAPISGRIGLRQVDVGNIVHTTDQNGIVVITQVQPIGLLFSVPEDNVPPIINKLHSGAQLPVDAYDRSGTRKLASGVLATVDNQIDQATGTLRLKAIFENKDSSLFPNQFVNVRLLVDTVKNVILVPSVAIQRGPEGTYVFLVYPDATAHIRPVTVNVITGSEASISKGLAGGETVVTDGMDKLRENSKVRIPGPAPGGERRGSQTVGRKPPK